MTQETAGLTIKVTQDGVAKAADALNDLTAAAVKAEGVASNLASEFACTDKAARAAAAGGSLYQRQTEQMNRSNAAASKSINGVTSDLASQQAALQSLLGKIDPVVGAYGRLDEMEKQLKGFNASGLLADDDYAGYAEKINTYRVQLEQSAMAATAGHKAEAAAAREAAQAEMKAQATKEAFIASLRMQSETMGMTTAELLQYKAAQLGVTAQASPYIQKLYQQDGTVKAATLSTKQYAQAMRMLPMQMTDIVTSLASGMPVWMIAIQQGGQIKDSFGGIGNAAKALISYINPVTIGLGALAGVAVAVALAYKQGSDETTAFNNAITLTGGYAGKTSGQLEDMAKSINSSIGTTSAAAKALTSALSTGAFSGDSLQEIGKTAVAMQVTTGKAIDESIADFKKLSDDPLQGSVALNNQYHYLTQAVYDQIYALQQQGNTQAAQKVAEDAYASAMQSRASAIHDNLGFIESGWQAVWNSAKGAWDAMLGIGREKSLSELLSEAQKTANGYQMGKLTVTGGPQAQANVSILQRALDLQKDVTGAQAIGREEQDQAIKAQGYVNTLTEQSLSNAQKRTKEQLALTRAIQQGAKISAAEEATLRKNIDDRYKDPKTPKAKAVTDDQATRTLLQLKEQQAAMEGEVAVNDKLTKGQQDLVSFNQLIADLKNKQILTADQKSLLANESELRTQYEVNSALSVRVKLHADLLKLQERTAQLNESMASAYSGAGDQYQRQLNAYGKGDKAVERTDSTASIYKEYQRYQEQLDKATPKELLGSDAYKTETANIKTQLDARLQQQSDYYAQLDALQGDWTNGATAAYQNYIDSAKDIAGQTKEAFTNAFGSMEEALVSFVTTGKLSFRSFATSVLDDMARIAIRTASSSALSSIFGFVGSAASAYAGGTTASTGSAGAYSSAANSSLSFNAKGGAYDSPGLSAYSGQVVSRPTYFAFASGGGVMGEAGPEAILPLTRDSSGSLGVRAKGGSAAAMTFAPTITLTVDQRGNDNDQQQQNNTSLLKGLSKLMDAKLASFKMEMTRPGFN
ncbi:phage tail tape measure protein [Sodalis sp. RH22]|uniref:phage tail tape measure protein n=1 Tax=unclassified Sodalis (in: enterobacteria) TaxID=2636512 RepID=UPI0039B3C3B7